MLSFGFLKGLNAEQPRIDTLNVVYPSHVPATKFVHFGNVKNFTIVISRYTSVRSEFPFTFEKLATLEVLARFVEQLPVDLIMKQAPTLTSLSLPVMRWADFDQFTNILNKLPRVENVKLHWSMDVDNMATMELFERESLNQITFTTETKLQADDLMTFIASVAGWQVVANEKVQVGSFDLYEVTMVRVQHRRVRLSNEMKHIRFEWTMDVDDEVALELFNRNDVSQITFSTPTKFQMDALLSLVQSVPKWQVTRSGQAQDGSYEVVMGRKRNPFKRMFEAYL